jgi:hypothetical protein
VAYEGLPAILSGIARGRVAGCNTSMILRRLMAWFRMPRSSPRPQEAAEAHSDGGPLDLNEFGRLLNSGKTEDLQKIARALARRQNVRI